MSEEKQPRKASSVRHTRAIQHDHTKHSIAALTAEEIQERLTEIVHPATLAQVNYFHQLGLRERTLSLTVMVAFVLEMIWRQISGVNELVRLIQTEAMLWAAPKKVSQQALSQRLATLLSDLFLNILFPGFPRITHPRSLLKKSFFRNDLLLKWDIASVYGHFCTIYPKIPPNFCLKWDARVKQIFRQGSFS